MVDTSPFIPTSASSCLHWTCSHPDKYFTVSDNFFIEKLVHLLVKTAHHKTVNLSDAD